MNSNSVWRHAVPILGISLLGISAPLTTSAQAISGNFQYHAEARDTLIGLGRRLLLEPRRWHEVQSRNHIADPRRIPRGAIIQIPYEWLKTSAESASVSSITGIVQQAGAKISPGDVLPEGSVIETGSDGSVTIDLADGSVVTLQKSTTLRLDQMTRVTGVAAAHSIRLKLESGRVETVVKPHRDVGRFEIITPVAVSAVRGTQFRDSFHGEDNRATAETLAGTVSVSGGSGAVPVPAGFGTRVERDQAPLPPVVLLPPPSLANLPSTNTTAVLRVPLQAVAGATSYRVQLATDAQFHAITADTVAAEDSASLAAVPDGDYWLRARSIDGLGLEGADSVRQIKQHVLPDPPQPLAPANSEKITGTHVRLAWADAAAGARYVLQVAADAAFTSPLLDRALDAAMADVDDQAPGRYYWRVATLNAHNEAGSWSAVQSYVQRAAMSIPDVPRLTGKQFDFTWAELPGESYRAQVARDPDFKHMVTEMRLEQPRWSVPKPFPGIYYLRVQAIDSDGSAGPFGEARRFVSPIPTWVKIATPVAIALSLVL